MRERDEVVWDARSRFSENEDIDEIIEEDFIGLRICGSSRLESICWHAERILLKKTRSHDSLFSLPEIESYRTDGKFRRDTIIPDIGRPARKMHSACTREVQQNSRLVTWNFSCGAL